MRIISGQAKGRRLTGPWGRGTRPTSSRTRAALFSSLEATGVDMGRVLDLYAGSGALGIEALSRGAAWCDFVERSPAACAAIRENLRRAGLAGRAAVHCSAAERALPRLKGPYTLVLADPPYDDPSAIAVLERLARSTLVEPGRTVLALEHRSRQSPPSLIGPLRLTKTLRHGDSAVSLYR